MIPGFSPTERYLSSLGKKTAEMRIPAAERLGSVTYPLYHYIKLWINVQRQIAVNNAL